MKWRSVVALAAAAVACRVGDLVQTPPAGARLEFSVQPSPAKMGEPITPPVKVMVRDDAGLPDMAYDDSVAVDLGQNPGGAALVGTSRVQVQNGVATFADLRVDKPGNGYVLRATAPGRPPVMSAAFGIDSPEPPPATQLAFTVQPTNTQAGNTITPPIQVAARDASGSVVASYTGTITIAIGSNPASGTLSGTLSAAASNGVATFNNLQIDRAGTGYTLRATSGSLTAATSSAFNITAPPQVATQLAFTVQPSNAQTGQNITPAIQVAARDASGNVVTSFTGTITIAIGTNPAAGTLSGTLSAPASSGVATFANLRIDNAGNGYTLRATSGSLTAATSAAFNITAPPPVATQLAFTVQPTNTQAGNTITPPVQVAARDAAGSLVTSFTGTITIAIGTNPAGGTLSGTLSAAASGGVATFAGLSIDRAGTGYTLRATSGSLTAATSAAFNMTAPPQVATQLAFTVQPSNTQAGNSITPPVQVAARDAAGSLVTSFTGTITIAIGTNPAGGTLSGTLSAAASSGVATFANLRIDDAGTGYTLRATSGSLTAATSAAFNITAPPQVATQLAFTVQPSNAQTGQNITPAIQVAARDASGNVVTSFTGTITIAIGTNPAGGTLSGTLSAAASSGVATFAGLQIDRAGTGYTLRATSGSLTAATSTAFNITAPPPVATQLAFTVQPTNAQEGNAITPAVRVAARDADGNVVTSFTGTITIAIATNPGAGTLTGTLSAAASSGVATFGNLRIDRAGTGYTLRATAGSLTAATSAAFNVTAPPPQATQLAFTVQPSTTEAGSPITPTIQVAARDPAGNLVTSYAGAITLAIGNNPGGGTLSGTTSSVASNGIAMFPGLRIDRAGTGYTLTAAASGLAGATSTAFNITTPPPVATQLAFTVQPTNTQEGNAITPAVQVAARDASGNVVTTFTGTISIAIGTNAGGGTLTGTLSAAASNGVATFANLHIDRAGTGYTLRATSGSLTAATSAAFNITAPPPVATQLAFTVQPSTTQAGNTITPPVQVAARDASGNVVTSFTGTITIAIGTNPAGGTLSGTLSAAASSGVATFANLRIDNAGNGYTLRATSGSLTAATSAAFNVTAPPPVATQLAFTVQPTNTQEGNAITPAVQVTARDASGNVVTSFTGTITIAIGTNPAGGTLTGTLSATASSGVATFTNLRLDRAGTGYTLRATAGSLTAATSAAFNITAPPPVATQLAFTVQPATTQAGNTIAPPIKVAARDASGNVVTTFTGTITIAIGTNPAGGTLSGTLSAAASSGVATFANLRIDNAGNGYTLRATSGSLTAATSAAFNITAPPPVATQLAFTVQPATTQAGNTITPPIKVAARDASGNVVTTFTGTITIAIGTNPAGGTLSGTLSAAANSGVATFANLRIDNAGNGYTLRATSGSLTAATSNAFNITAPPPTPVPTALRFIVQPSNTGLNQQISPPVQVEVLDQNGNRITNYTGAITIDLAPNLLNATVYGTVTVNASNGVATFSNLRVNLVGIDFRLRAAFAGQSPIATSNAFIVLL